LTIILNLVLLINIDGRCCLVCLTGMVLIYMDTFMFYVLLYVIFIARPPLLY
jgi:hypothetical protein